MDLDYTVPTTKTYDEAVKAVQDKAAENGFRVQFTNDVAATLAERGFAREPVTHRGSVQRQARVCGARGRYPDRARCSRARS